MSILKCTTIYSVIEKLPWYDYRKELCSEAELLHVFKLCNAYWYHDGDPKRPHAELTSGLCSNGFFDCLRVLKYLAFSELFAAQLSIKIEEFLKQHMLPYPSWVIGSPMAGITFAHDVARELEAPINMCVEKDPTNPKKMIWNRMQIPNKEVVLQVEELVTSAHTLNEVERALLFGNGGPVNFLHLVAILVHRPPKLPVTHYGRRAVVALIEKEIWAVPRSECPLCVQGSKRLRPKQNWAELTGK